MRSEGIDLIKRGRVKKKGCKRIVMGRGSEKKLMKKMMKRTYLLLKKDRRRNCKKEVRQVLEMRKAKQFHTIPTLRN